MTHAVEWDQNQPAVGEILLPPAGISFPPVALIPAPVFFFRFYSDCRSSIMHDTHRTS